MNVNSQISTAKARFQTLLILGIVFGYLCYLYQEQFQRLSDARGNFSECLYYKKLQEDFSMYNDTLGANDSSTGYLNFEPEKEYSDCLDTTIGFISFYKKTKYVEVRVNKGSSSYCHLYQKTYKWNKEILPVVLPALNTKGQERDSLLRKALGLETQLFDVSAIAIALFAIKESKTDSTKDVNDTSKQKNSDNLLNTANYLLGESNKNSLSRLIEKELRDKENNLKSIASTVDVKEMSSLSVDQVYQQIEKKYFDYEFSIPILGIGVSAIAAIWLLSILILFVLLDFSNCLLIIDKFINTEATEAWFIIDTVVGNSKILPMSGYSTLVLLPILLFSGLSYITYLSVKLNGFGTSPFLYSMTIGFVFYVTYIMSKKIVMSIKHIQLIRERRTKFFSDQNSTQQVHLQ